MRQSYFVTALSRGRYLYTSTRLTPVMWRNLWKNNWRATQPPPQSLAAVRWLANFSSDDSSYSNNVTHTNNMTTASRDRYSCRGLSWRRTCVPRDSCWNFLILINRVISSPKVGWVSDANWCGGRPVTLQIKHITNTQWTLSYVTNSSNISLETLVLKIS